MPKGSLLKHNRLNGVMNLSQVVLARTHSWHPAWRMLQLRQAGVVSHQLWAVGELLLVHSRSAV